MLIIMKIKLMMGISIFNILIVVTMMLKLTVDNDKAEGIRTGGFGSTDK